MKCAWVRIVLIHSNNFFICWNTSELCKIDSANTEIFDLFISRIFKKLYEKVKILKIVTYMRVGKNLNFLKTIEINIFVNT